MIGDVRIDDILEFFGNAGPAQGHRLFAINEDRRRRLLAGSRQADADIGVLAFAGAVDDASHDRHLHGLDAVILRRPFRHFGAHITLDFVGQMLEHGARCPPASGAGDNLRNERAEPHGLQNFLGYDHFAAAVAARLRGQRNTDGIADAFLQEHRQGGRGGDDAFRSQPRLGKSEMQGIIPRRGQFPVNGDQVLHLADLARQHDFIAPETQPFGFGGAFHGRGYQRIVHDNTGIIGRGFFGVLVHHPGQQLAIEAAPIDADANRLIKAQRRVNHGPELDIALFLKAHIAGIDAVFAQGRRAVRIFGQQRMAIVMEIANQRHVAAHGNQAVADHRDLFGGVFGIDGDADQFRARRRQLGHLICGCLGVGGIGVGHRLHDNRMPGTNGDTGNIDTYASAPGNFLIVVSHEIAEYYNNEGAPYQLQYQAVCCIVGPRPPQYTISGTRMQPSSPQVETPSGKDAAYENFPVGSWLLPAKLRPHIADFYGFARTIDDIADAPDLDAGVKVARLEGFARTILGTNADDALYQTGHRMRASLIATGVATDHCLDLISAFKQDAVKSRYDNWAELIDYCLRSAAPVGRYLLDLHGGADDGYASSDALCNALQVLNHLQDAKADYLELDRVYLPADWMAEAGADVEDLSQDRITPELRRVYARMLKSTGALLDGAGALPATLASVRLAMEAGSILSIAQLLSAKLARSDPLAGRVALNKLQYLRACSTGAGKAVLSRWR